MANRPQRLTDAGKYAMLAQVGMEMVAPIGLGLLLDYQLNTLPWLTVAGAGLGFVGGLGHLITIVNRNDRSESPGSGPGNDKQV